MTLAKLIISSEPQHTAAVPSNPTNNGASGVPSVARAAMLFLIAKIWMFLLRNSARKRELELASKPITFTNRAS